MTKRRRARRKDSDEARKVGKSAQEGKGEEMSDASEVEEDKKERDHALRKEATRLIERMVKSLSTATEMLTPLATDVCVWIPHT